MKLAKKTRTRQKAILARIKAGLPVAGLLTGMAALTGCENPIQPVGIEPAHVVGKEPAAETCPPADNPPAKPETPPSNGQCEQGVIQAVGIEPKRPDQK